MEGTRSVFLRDVEKRCDNKDLFKRLLAVLPIITIVIIENILEWWNDRKMKEG